MGWSVGGCGVVWIPARESLCTTWGVWWGDTEGMDVLHTSRVATSSVVAMLAQVVVVVLLRAWGDGDACVQKEGSLVRILLRLCMCLSDLCREAQEKGECVRARGMGIPGAPGDAARGVGGVGGPRKGLLPTPQHVSNARRSRSSPLVLQGAPKRDVVGGKGRVSGATRHYQQRPFQAADDGCMDARWRAGGRGVKEAKLDRSTTVVCIFRSRHKKGGPMVGSRGTPQWHHHHRQMPGQMCVVFCVVVLAFPRSLACSPWCKLTHIHTRALVLHPQRTGGPSSTTAAPAS